MSVAYYDTNARAYFDSTVLADMKELRARFLHHVRPGGAILDAGCGSGRDARAFSEAGYLVTAFDASAEMVRLAKAYTGLPILHMMFGQMDWQGTFDGIWSSASLLHVPRADLASVFRQFTHALAEDGTWYLSMKEGTMTRTIDGRLFTDVAESELRGLLVDAGLDVVEMWRTDDVRPERSDCWLNALVQKNGPGILQSGSSDAG
jgi:2-polyprenyl-3-methyl-5-hydroxy-6-metoxy-1,4-benzoquinol methylase